MVAEPPSSAQRCAARCGHAPKYLLSELRSVVAKPWCGALGCYDEIAAQLAEEAGFHKSAASIRMRNVDRD